MKVLHICYSDSRGGAAIGAYRLHNAMRHRGVESEFFAIHKGTHDDSVTRLLNHNNSAQYNASMRHSDQLRDLYDIEGLPIRTINLTGLNVADRINSHPAEIVQLHWIGNNTLRLSDFPLIERPIVWKMPDMWPFSGGEHYIRHGDPERYKQGYDVTPSFLGETVDVDRFIFEAKRQYYIDLSLTVVSPSRFLAQCAHESALLGDYDCHVIPNPLASTFIHGPIAEPAEQKIIRDTIGLPQDKTIVMFGAFSTKEVRKGFHHIQDVAAKHLADIATPQEMAFLVCGADQPGVETLNGYDVFVRPTTEDPAEFKRYLRASDLLLFPSEMDSTAMVVQEALAQGVPSIVFDVGGLPEMVVHEKNGYLAKPYDAADLANGLAWWRDCENKKEVREFAAKRSREMHEPTQTVDSYLKLYDQVLERYRNGASFKTKTFHEAPAPGSLKDTQTKTPKRVFILDPSAVGLTDSSHHAEHVLAFASLFAATHLTPILVVNEAADIQNPFGDTQKLFDYKIYDKIRAKDDARSGPQVDADRIAELDQSSEKSFAIYDALIKLDQQYEFTGNDAILFPTIDRFVFEGLLFYLYGNQTPGSPSFHVNIMFEKAEFLLGRYPLDRLMNAANGSTYLGKKLYLYAETQQMADDLAGHFNVPVKHLPPPSLFSKELLTKIKTSPIENNPVTDIALGEYEKSEMLRDAVKTGDTFKKPSGKRIVASLGRGRRDKGWARLPAIVEAFNAASPSSNTVFVVQKPRSMDGLEKEESMMAALPNVIMLDEIISDEMLDSVCEQADVFLLPYDPGVYHNRGSAFCWRAVSLGKPLVVSGGTALSETLLENDGSTTQAPQKPFQFLSRRNHGAVTGPYANGHIATTPQEIASAIADIINNQGAYESGAFKMLQNYYRTSVRENPVKKTLYESNFHAARRTLIIQDIETPLTPPKMASEGYSLTINVAEEKPSGLASVLGQPGETPLNFSIHLQDGVIRPESLPGFVRDALDSSRVAAIYVPKDLAIAKGLLRGWPEKWRRLIQLF